MTEAELKEARDLVEEMEREGARDLYFEINGAHSRLLGRYIRDLEQRVVKHDTPPK